MKPHLWLKIFILDMKISSRLVHFKETLIIWTYTLFQDKKKLRDFTTRIMYQNDLWRSQ